MHPISLPRPCVHKCHGFLVDHLSHTLENPHRSRRMGLSDYALYVAPCASSSATSSLSPPRSSRICPASVSTTRRLEEARCVWCKGRACVLIHAYTQLITDANPELVRPVSSGSTRGSERERETCQSLFLRERDASAARLSICYSFRQTSGWTLDHGISTIWMCITYSVNKGLPAHPM